MKKNKQVIVMATYLNMRRGKQIAQGAHASVGAISNDSHFASKLSGEVIGGNITLSSDAAEWLFGLQKKVCVGIGSEKELLEIYYSAKSAGLPCYLVKDAGLTEFKEPTYTCCAIGPASEEEIDKITGNLKLL